ncbi:hypothetical protein VAE063_320001 [Vibrio aestuarianus]|uniref:Uncharacterized protein n=1 Tax=Vibrio aestuarianus TaxID=28171 RepID=A0ABM9FKZ4_9VIBR|nr:hypothetical protein VAE063_320001 [Vibrio aestuarianus]
MSYNRIKQQSRIDKKIRFECRTIVFMYHVVILVSFIIC